MDESENIPIAYEVNPNVLEEPLQIVVVAESIPVNQVPYRQAVFDNSRMSRLTYRQRVLFIRKFIETVFFIILLSYGLIYFFNM